MEAVLLPITFSKDKSLEFQSVVLAFRKDNKQTRNLPHSKKNSLSQLITYLGKKISELNEELTTLLETVKKASLFSNSSLVEKTILQIEKKIQTTKEEINIMEKELQQDDECKKNLQLHGHYEVALKSLNRKLQKMSTQFGDALAQRIQALNKKNEWEQFYMATKTNHNPSPSEVVIQFQEVKSNPNIDSTSNERVHAILDIQQKIISIKELYSTVTNLINEQSWFIGRIEDDIEYTNNSLTDVEFELRKKNDSVSSNKRLMMMLGMVFVGFTSLFLFVVA